MLEQEIWRYKLTTGKTKTWKLPKVLGAFSMRAGGSEDEVSERTMCGLFRLDADLSVHELERGIICNNGPCWSPDNKTFYHNQQLHEVDVRL